MRTLVFLKDVSIVACWHFHIICYTSRLDAWVVGHLSQATAHLMTSSRFEPSLGHFGLAAGDGSGSWADTAFGEFGELESPSPTTMTTWQFFQCLWLTWTAASIGLQPALAHTQDSCMSNSLYTKDTYMSNTPKKVRQTFIRNICWVKRDSCNH